MDPGNEAIKAMIEFAETPEDADDVITRYTPWRTYNDKLVYLSGMFDVAILGGFDSKDGDPIETDYQAALAAIVNKKWR